MLGACVGLPSACATDPSPAGTDEAGTEGTTGNDEGSGSPGGDPGGESVGESDNGALDDGSDDAGVMADPDGPQIVSLTVNSELLGEGDSLLVTVIVTDPDGIDDVIGGELRTVGGASYGAFVTAAQEGAYSLQVPWDVLHSLEPIAGAPSLPRQMRAHFFDQAAHETTAEIEVTLACDDGLSFCDGACFDLASDLEHCGTCDNPADGDGQTCTAGSVVCAEENSLECGDGCVPLSLEHCGTCNNDCTIARLPQGDWWSHQCLIVDETGEELPMEDWYCAVEKAFDAGEPLDCNVECGDYDCVFQYGYYDVADEVIVEACDASLDETGLDYKGCFCAT